MVLSKKDVQVEVRDATRPPAGSGGGASPPKTWVISGRLRVREAELESSTQDRPLKGVEVKVQASDIGADGPWSTWGVVRTDADGDFSASEQNDGKTRFFRVQARLVAADLTVEDGSLIDLGNLDIADRNWRTVWKSNGQLSGPDVGIGTKVVASGQPEDLGDAYFRRQALIWYLLRTTLDTLKAQDAWLGIDDQVKVLYPARSGIAVSTRNGATIHLQTGTSDWQPDVVLPYFWQSWHDSHISGTGKLGQSFPSERFSAGFASFATMAIMHELWGGRLAKPFSRRHVAAVLEISTLDELERSEEGVQHALCLLRFDGRSGWWNHLFGTAQRSPDGRPDGDGNGDADHPAEVGVKHRLDGRTIPAEPGHLTLWEILLAFRADPKDGWASDLDLGEGENGLLRFIDRAADIYDLSENTRSMLLDALDPLSTKQPYEWLPRTAA